MLTNTHKIKQILALLVILTLTFCIYLQGLPGDFIFDDFYNIVDNKSLYIDNISFENIKKVIFSNNSGPLKRSISMLSFAMNGYFGGITPTNIKLTNIIIHLINGVLVFSLTRLTYLHLLLSFPGIKINKLSPWLPLIVAAAWLLHPINLTSILYSVQRMSSLAALFVFLGLNNYLWLRLKQIKGYQNTYFIITTLGFFTVLGVLTKESAALLPLFAFCYELSILKFNASDKSAKTKLVFFYKAFIFFVLTALILLFIKQPDSILGGYSHRDFNLVERLLTETRVLWFYIFLVLTPKLSQFGIFHDDIVISTSLISPISTLFSCIGLILLIAVAFAIRKKQPLVYLSCLMFFFAHSIESTILPLEIAHEHRNYIASYALLLGLFFSIIQLIGHKLYPGAILCTLIISFFILITALRTSLWGQPVDLVLVNRARHPLSARSNYESARLYTRLILKEENKDIKQKYYDQAKQLFSQSYKLKNSYLSGLIGSLWLDSLLKKYDQNNFNLLIKNLALQKITPKTVSSLQGLNQCMHSETCNIDKEQMYDLLLTAIKNPKNTKSGLVSLMTEASITALTLSRFQEAVNIAYDATKSDPDNQQLKLNFISVLIQLKSYDNAAIELEKLEKSGLEADMVEKFNHQKKILKKLRKNNT